MTELLIFIGLAVLVTFLVTLFVPHRWNKFLLILAALVAYSFSFTFSDHLHYGGPGGVVGRAFVLFLAIGLAIAFIAALAIKELFRESDGEPSKNSLADIACVVLPAFIAPVVIFGHFAALCGMMSGRLAGLFLGGLSGILVAGGLVWLLSARSGRIRQYSAVIAILIAFGAGCALVTVESYRWAAKTLGDARRTAGGKDFCIQVISGVGYAPATSTDDLSPLVMRAEGRRFPVFHAILFVDSDGTLQRYNWSYRFGSFQKLDPYWSNGRALKQVCRTARDGGISGAR